MQGSSCPFAGDLKYLHETPWFGDPIEDNVINWSSKHKYYPIVNNLLNVVSKFTQYVEYLSSPYFLVRVWVNVKLIGNGEDEAL